MNITNHVERGSRLFPDKPALVFEGKSFSYKALNIMANQVANGLQELGIVKGDRVALFLPNIPEFVISYLGILKLGAIAISLNTMLKQDEVKFILNDCTAKILFTTAELSQQVSDHELPALEQIVIAEGNTTKGISLTHLMANASPDAHAIELDNQDPAVIIYTSGTTGFPKGATLSHANVIANSYAQNRCCGMQPSDRLLLYLPLFHCFAQNAILNSGLNTCSTIILERMFHPEKMLKTIVTEQVTMFFGVPTVFIFFLNRDITAYDMTSIRYYFAAAAPMPLEITQQWQKKYGLVIHEGYGLTEASPCTSYNHDLKYKLGSIGSPIDNVEMKIINSDGTEAEVNQLGEIIVRGPNVMLGYWNNPDETAKVIKNGWLYTGDIGRIDEEGYFYIVDRLKDMINLSGLKVYPAEVENVIYQHPAVAEVAVYGVPNLLQGELVNANIRLKPGQVTTQAEMIAFCSQKLATYKIPRAMKFVDSIPKNPTGKILKNLLREQELVNISTPSK
ncbi:long-chain fatty acid--CoA ligase [Nodularia sp. UHCC 0506]|uniref:class I adenylate-forming enzyme family protein n=1 Tax=Nodularia sp. UHCC 0506 TaxID=3110243 RepID=UPI002B1E9C73|nr:long-chain fatty acid--CoA ligase [Nodularia sp. UHCC 0506]MEA5516844.1 long-chain fatty acid--CoA ligase [Nodularia sp. UHCC 0506]